MEIRTVEAAIRITANKYQYDEAHINLLRKEIENGNYKVITKDYGARDFVTKYYESKNEEQPIDLYDLNEFLSYSLKGVKIKKENPNSLKYMRQALFIVMNNNKTLKINDHIMNKKVLEDLMIEVAIKYSDSFGENTENNRPYAFDRKDITRREACDLTKITSNNFKQDVVYEALNTYPDYAMQIIDNMIIYTCYENDYSRNSEIQNSDRSI